MDVHRKTNKKRSKGVTYGLRKLGSRRTISAQIRVSSMYCRAETLSIWLKELAVVVENDLAEDDLHDC